MKSKLLPLILFTSLSIMANTQTDPLYQQTQINIQNKTSHAVLIQIYDNEGTWQKSVSNNFTLAPYANYKNRISSIKTGGFIKNATSIDISEIKNPRENYFIFGEETNSRRHSIAGHIFDGLGLMFANGWTNHCDQRTPDDFGKCIIVIH